MKKDNRNSRRGRWWERLFSLKARRTKGVSAHRRKRTKGVSALRPRRLSRDAKFTFVGVMLAIVLTAMTDYFKVSHETIQLRESQLASLQTVKEELAEDATLLLFMTGLRNYRTLDELDGLLDRGSLGRLKVAFTIRMPRDVAWSDAMEIGGVLQDNPKLMGNLSSIYGRMSNLTRSVDDLLSLWSNNVLPEERTQDLEAERALVISEIMNRGFRQIATEAASVRRAIAEVQGPLENEIEVARQLVPTHGGILNLWQKPKGRT
jgi:hypothetical protein